MALVCSSIIVPPANCSGHGTLVPANCTCACEAGYVNDLTVRSRGGGRWGQGGGPERGCVPSAPSNLTQKLSFNPPFKTTTTTAAAEPAQPQVVHQVHRPAAQRAANVARAAVAPIAASAAAPTRQQRWGCWWWWRWQRRRQRRRGVVVSDRGQVFCIQRRLCDAGHLCTGVGGAVFVVLRLQPAQEAGVHAVVVLLLPLLLRWQ
jgi:hypothetical protein